MKRYIVAVITLMMSMTLMMACNDSSEELMQSKETSTVENSITTESDGSVVESQGSNVESNTDSNTDSNAENGTDAVWTPFF